MNEITQCAEIGDERVPMHDVFSTGLHQRYMYTQSECSSGLSTISSLSRYSLPYKLMHTQHLELGDVKQALSVCACFVVTGLGAGLPLVYGLLEDNLELLFGFRERPPWDWQRSRTSILIGAMQFASYFAVCRMAVWAQCRMGVRVMVALGALATAAMQSKFWQLCLAYMLVGAGTSVSAHAAGRPRVGAAGVGAAAMGVLWQHLAVYTSPGRALRWTALACAGTQVLMVPFLFAPVWPASIEARPSDCGNAQAPSALRLSVDWRQAASLFGLLLHSMMYLLPFVFLPGYVTTQLPVTHHLSAALPVSVIGLGMAVGGCSAQPLRTWSGVQPSVVRCGARLGLSLAVWCLWLPAGSSWGMVCGFSAVYGLCLGVTGDACVRNTWANVAVVAGVAVGVPVGSWLFVGVGSGVYYMPLVTFTAAGLLLTAVCDAVSSA
ncbi:hypothetical protein DL89DRAFT_265515 [Linderina pennispora]|uniref:MFS general substrate transporter n=1 Tax=Linderina pennispora TaxID=61395 RepID=A0A1Y1WE64_9FUNG|nr:uncharacterized protein DL89DRAFT_265515 [Linderina pennispora]ORX71797.1 hypothetical protein DL89DRAFT_265515 [Linderina pennispora]